VPRCWYQEWRPQWLFGKIWVDSMFKSHKHNKSSVSLHKFHPFCSLLCSSRSTDKKGYSQRVYSLDYWYSYECLKKKIFFFGRYTIDNRYDFFFRSQWNSDFLPQKVNEALVPSKIHELHQILIFSQRKCQIKNGCYTHQNTWSRFHSPCVSITLFFFFW
jgi:hypothetical protein